MVSSHSFVVWDYVIFGITIVISISIGLYYAFAGGRQKTTSEFLVGNRRMKVLPVAISLMVSFESSIMMLGVPAEVYEYGIQYVLKLVGFLIADLLAIQILVPLIHPLKITSAYEYLELRFKSRAVRLTGTVVGISSYTCYIGVVLFGPGVALEAVTGFPKWVSIVVIAAAAILYTSIVSTSLRIFAGDLISTGINVQLLNYAAEMPISVNHHITPFADELCPEASMASTWQPQLTPVVIAVPPHDQTPSHQQVCRSFPGCPRKLYPTTATKHDVQRGYNGAVSNPRADNARRCLTFVHRHDNELQINER
ncbi:sodium-coupled monocarboxylate transporter 1-like [Pecten maximus]|uniref:sodium-coupled monocarboxylate transporter 1-like n=1 Tax=Pecten maximus TaxID=6579 RepID=UPI0014587597|nr:sodium-coupled monocarboxylate transporter 1-like [Pecten maximus]